jgi:predicted alpha/beta hydrolase family esterase
MKNAILLHGKPGKEEYYDPTHASASNSHWFPWLQKQLLVRDIAAQTPEVPNCWKPYYPTWQKEFERYEITPDTILVGHSCGAGFIVRWLSEHKDVRVGKVVLVAPSLGKDWVKDDFFEFEIDPDLADRSKGLVIFGSDNDRPSILEAIAVFRSTIKNVQYREFPGYRHFTYGSMKTIDFPELLEETLR